MQFVRSMEQPRPSMSPYYPSTVPYIDDLFQYVYTAGRH
jgi:hypothetical protein